jgi:hypothetical protein
MENAAGGGGGTIFTVASTPLMEKPRVLTP